MEKERESDRGRIVRRRSEWRREGELKGTSKVTTIESNQGQPVKLPVK